MRPQSQVQIIRSMMRRLQTASIVHQSTRSRWIFSSSSITRHILAHRITHKLPIILHHNRGIIVLVETGVSNGDS